jgi:hypothetical protein
MQLDPQFRFDRKIAAGLLRDPETFAVVILTILLEAYGGDVLDPDELDPLELYMRVEEDFRVVLPLEAENRIQAALTAINTPAFYVDPLITRATAMALMEGNLGDMVNGYLEDVPFTEVIWAVYEIGLILGEDDTTTFSPSVSAYIQRLAQEAEEAPVEGDLEEVLPYYVKILEPEKQRLKEQLRKLGAVIPDEGLL